MPALLSAISCNHVVIARRERVDHCLRPLHGDGFLLYKSFPFLLVCQPDEIAQQHESVVSGNPQTVLALAGRRQARSGRAKRSSLFALCFTEGHENLTVTQGCGVCCLRSSRLSALFTAALFSAFRARRADSRLIISSAVVIIMKENGRYLCVELVLGPFYYRWKSAAGKS